MPYSTLPVQSKQGQAQFILLRSPHAKLLVSISQPITGHCICKLLLFQLFIESYEGTQFFREHQTQKTRALKEEI